MYYCRNQVFWVKKKNLQFRFVGGRKLIMENNLFDML